jgi:signal transduction histidine kinase/heme exporter protein D
MWQESTRPFFARGIGVRIFILSWLVSILTLAIFVIAIIPEQKRDLQDALTSKARGISSSLQEVTAGAAISEDYSSVVDHCVQVLAGDDAIDYIVITKNDGTSVMVERNGWRADKLGEFWRPTEHQTIAGIRVVPVFGRRVFHFARPFDYSGIQWGWIHVGLSLSSYDLSVSRIYHRTGLIAVFCVALSLLVSVVYARRQARPIRSLQAVVGQVAKGDFSARAPLGSRDEIESLALSFNSMADSLLQRNQILESVRLAAQEFLAAPAPQDVIPRVLERLGNASHSSVACLVEIVPGPPAGTGSMRHQWTAPGLAAGKDGDALQECVWKSRALEPYFEPLSRGEAVSTDSLDGLAGYSDLPLCPKSIILIPIHAGDEWFGFLGFGDCTGARVWSEAELDAFRAMAGMLGASMTRQRAQDDLVEAKATLEKRVTERTQELQDQVHAKERALAELAEAQKRLIEMSRLSGMAEVATGVLHNVGNVLNSVNVSANLVASKIGEFRLDHLAAAIDMLQQHQDDADTFLRDDPKGQRLLPYLSKLGLVLQQDCQTALTELQLLQNHIGHIKTIVATQQNYAKVSGLIEELRLADLAEDALHIVEAGLERHQIRVERDFEDLPPVAADKHKILQILLNLLRNAKESIKQSQNQPRFVRLSIRRHNDDRVRIEVQDSGVGLARENLTRIFAHGYTTKSNGHGFGLHSGALAAQEMSGSLWAESEGLGRGATFILDLPLVEAHERIMAYESFKNF